MSISSITTCLNCLVGYSLSTKFELSNVICSRLCKASGFKENKSWIRSPSSLIDPRYPPSAARLNGPSAWCPSRTPAYIQIDLDESSKITPIATQGGTARDKWVQRSLKDPFKDPSPSPNDPICLRAELYGCHPNPGNLLFL